MLCLMEVQSGKNWRHLSDPENLKHLKMILATAASSYELEELVSFDKYSKFRCSTSNNSKIRITFLHLLKTLIKYKYFLQHSDWEQ